MCKECDRDYNRRFIRKAVIWAAIIGAGVFWTRNHAKADEPEQWTRADTVLEVTWQLANVADALQTSHIKDRADLMEGNPITRAVIGAEPEGRDVALYFGTMAVSHYVIARLLPPKWRRFYHVGTIAYTTQTVVRNCADYNLCKP